MVEKAAMICVGAVLIGHMPHHSCGGGYSVRGFVLFGALGVPGAGKRGLLNT